MSWCWCRAGPSRKGASRTCAPIRACRKPTWGTGHDGALAASEACADVPSPLVGEGSSEIQQRRSGEGFERTAHDPSPDRACCHFCVALSHKGRGRINCCLAPGRTARQRLMLSVSNVVAGYGAHDEVLKGVGLTVAERELVVLIGPNGAGKSTLLKSIAGFLKPREGAIDFEGRSIGGLKPREITRQGIAFVPQEANVFPSLSVEANLEMGGYVDRRATKERIKGAFARFPVLAERRTQEARTLSGGQRQMLAVALALMAAPRLMLLDEPSAGLSPTASAELFNLIKALHQE